MRQSQWKQRLWTKNHQVPQMQQEFNRSLAGLSWVMSVFPIVGMIGGLIAGILVQRQGDRSMLILGLVILGAAFMGATRLIDNLAFDC